MQSVQPHPCDSRVTTSNQSFGSWLSPESSFPEKYQPARGPHLAAPTPTSLNFHVTAWRKKKFTLNCNKLTS